MIKKLFFSAAIPVALMAYFYSDVTPVSAYSAQAPPQGVTGAPGQGTCANAGCHAGGTLDDTSNANISHNIPNNTYVPDSTYTIILSISALNAAKNGFQVTAMDANNTIVGEFLANPIVTILSAGDYATHTPNSTGLSNWAVDWLAPSAGAGDITFYAAVNLSNANGNSLGDQIKLSNVTVTELGAPPIGVNELNLGVSVALYPTPLAQGNQVQLISSKTGLLNATVTDLQGKEVMHLSKLQVIENEALSLNVASLSKGIYVLTGSVNSYAFSKRLIIQ